MPLSPTGHHEPPSAVKNLLGPREALKKLVAENTALREAWNDANKRISRLEDEKMRFFDEGIYDLVNAVCGQKPGEPLRRRTFEQLQSSPTSLQSPPPATMLSPTSLQSARSRRQEAEKRSAELCGENEELRRELARASEVGEALERQQQQAEDRMHALEQERAWLAERLMRLGAGPGTLASPVLTTAAAGPSPALLSPGSPAAPPLGPVSPDVSVRQCLEELLRIQSQPGLQGTESVNSSECQGRLEAENLAIAECRAEKAKVEELNRQREESIRLISDLDGQTQALEKKLRDYEARTQSLEEENARLQAALRSFPAAELSAEAEPGTSPVRSQREHEGPSVAGALQLGESDSAPSALEPCDLEEAW